MLFSNIFQHIKYFEYSFLKILRLKKISGPPAPQKNKNVETLNCSDAEERA